MKSADVLNTNGKPLVLHACDAFDLSFFFASRRRLSFIRTTSNSGRCRCPDVGLRFLDLTFRCPEVGLRFLLLTFRDRTGRDVQNS